MDADKGAFGAAVLTVVKKSGVCGIQAYVFWAGHVGFGD